MGKYLLMGARLKLYFDSVLVFSQQIDLRIKKRMEDLWIKN